MEKFPYRSLVVDKGTSKIAFSRGGKVIGVAIKAKGHKWLLRIPGHQWVVTDDMGVSRLNTVPGDKITKTSVKPCKSWQAAAKELEKILGSG